MKSSGSEPKLGANYVKLGEENTENGMKKSSSLNSLILKDVVTRKMYQDIPSLAITGVGSSSAVRQIFEGEGEDGSRAELIVDKFTFSLVFSACVALLSSVQFGYHIGVINLPKQIIILAIDSETETTFALAVSIWAIGGWIGGSVGGSFADKIGRKSALLFNNLNFIIAAAIMYFAVAPWHLVIARFIAGLGCGIVTVIVPMYLGEIAPPNLRGTLGTCNQLGCVTGILVSQLLYIPCLDANGHGFWRTLLAISAFPSIIQLFLSIFFFHESPRWILCVSKNRVLATATLRQLRGYKNVDVEIESISMSSSDEGGEANKGSIWDVVNDKALRKPLFIGVVLQVAQQFTGINAIMFYSGSFFDKLNSDPASNFGFLGTVLVGIVNLLFTVVGVALIERLGRKFLLMLGTLIMLVASCVLTLALYMFTIDTANSTIWSYTVIGCVLVYVAAFEIGLGPIAWLMIAEIFPTKNRGPAMSVAVSVNWLCTFTVGQGFPTMNTFLGNAVFVPFIVVMIAFLIFGYTGGLIETQGKTLEQIQDEFQTRGNKNDDEKSAYNKLKSVA